MIDTTVEDALVALGYTTGWIVVDSDVNKITWVDETIKAPTKATIEKKIKELASIL